MKNVLKEKFKNNILVKPLYRKIKNRNKVKPKVLMFVDSVELDGRGVKIKRDIVNRSAINRLKDTNKRKAIFLCNGCARYNKNCIFDKEFDADGLKGSKMFSVVGNEKTNTKEDVEDKVNKLVQVDNNIVVLRKVPCRWLRVYPLPQVPEESMFSVILRCILCQVGLSTFLVLWTIFWVFIIHYFEGPYEIKLFLDFEKQQNQLVIDLATELRQITPVTNRWKATIEQRLKEACQMTSVAVQHGARLRPGSYFDLPGTFLFTIYVMTALGFGAPVPQTMGGRTSTLIYALLAVPLHFYLMMNLSMSIVVHAQEYVEQLGSRHHEKRQFVVGKTSVHNGNESHCSRNSEVLKAPDRCSVGKKIMRFLSMLCACHGVPLSIVLYYLAGAGIFSTLEGLEPLEIVMFPLEFTTSGELDHIADHVRILYGIYIEGAMVLIACALATLRRHSSLTIARASDKYRLFATDD